MFQFRAAVIGGTHHGFQLIIGKRIEQPFKNFFQRIF